jgi:hypothetical protein
MFPKKPLLFIIVLLSLSQARMLKENYQLHQHPFQYIGSGYQQDNGNDLCRQAYANMGGYRISSKIQSNQRPGHIIYAHDGAVINGASHVFYHQAMGQCVAKK